MELRFCVVFSSPSGTDCLMIFYVLLFKTSTAFLLVFLGVALCRKTDAVEK